jgi:hypothetical protein
VAQVKIYGLRGSLAPRRAALSDAIHAALMDSFGLPEENMSHPGINVGAAGEQR